MVSLVEGRRSCTSCSGRRSSREREAHLKEAWLLVSPVVVQRDHLNSVLAPEASRRPTLRGLPLPLFTRLPRRGVLGNWCLSMRLLFAQLRQAVLSELLSTRSIFLHGREILFPKGKGLKEPSRVVR